MNLNPDPAETARLEALAYQAQDYALHMMRTTGSVPPTVIADTKDGYVFSMGMLVVNRGFDPAMN